MQMLPKSFRNRLTLLFISLGAAVGAPLYFYIEQVYVQQLIQARSKDLHSIAVATATVISENLRERQREISLLAKAPIYDDYTASLGVDKLTGQLNQLKASYQYYSWIGFTDTQGVVRAASQNMLLGQNVSQRPWFQNGLQGDFIGDLHEAVLLKKLIAPTGAEGPIRFIDFAAPVLNAEHQLLGVVAAHAHWDWADAVIEVLVPILQSQKHLDVHILNKHQEVIYSTSNAHKLDEDILNDQAQEEIRLQMSGTQEFILAQQSIPDLIPDKLLGWSLLVVQPSSVIHQETQTLRHALLYLIVLATIVFVYLAWWMASRISHPIEHLAQQARRVQLGDEHLPDISHKTNIIEIEQLNTAISDMTKTLIQRRSELEQANRVLEEKVKVRTQELEQANNRLEQMVRIDPLTGVFNRLAAQEHIDRHFKQLKYTGDTYSLLMLDIDYFKRINDQYGHAEGDEALKRVAHTIRQNIRKTDCLFRMGGEEFMAILPHTSLREACTVAEKIRRAIASTPAPKIGNITISIGVALAQTKDTNSEIAIHWADQGLYLAKELGRNQVAIKTS